jgi:hypothetical protein
MDVFIQCSGGVFGDSQSFICPEEKCGDDDDLLLSAPGVSARGLRRIWQYSEQA